MAAYKYIKIPCKTHIRKFVKRKYGSPLLVDTQSLVGFFVFGLLGKEPYFYRNIDLSNDFLGKHYDDELILVISNHWFKNVGHSFSPEVLHALNRFLENQFLEQMYSYCEAYGKIGRERKDAIRDFMDIYDILEEVDVSMEALVKAEYRLRKRLEKLEEKIKERNLFSDLE